MQYLSKATSISLPSLPYLPIKIHKASGSNLTFESLEGFPPVSTYASLADANRNFHYSQAQ